MTRSSSRFRENTVLGPEQVRVGAVGREQRVVALRVLAAVNDRSAVEMHRRKLFWGQDP